MNVFAQQFCKTVLQVAIANDYLRFMRLFKNDHQPAITDTEADYVEADFSGYGQLGNTWSTVVYDPQGKASSSAGIHTFSHNGGVNANTIYGVFIVNGAGVLAYAERFTEPKVMAANGDQIVYTGKITATNE